VVLQAKDKAVNTWTFGDIPDPSYNKSLTLP
jgi:hypothetical protein